MTSQEATSIAFSLLSALYAAPHHGPAVASALPSAGMLPQSAGAVYAEMLQHGIGSGSLDYALFDSQVMIRSREAYEAVTKETSFIQAQQTHAKDATMMLTWAGLLAEHHHNGEIAKDLESFVKLAREGNESTGALVGRVISSLKGYLEGDAAGMHHIRKACSVALERVQEWKAGIVSDYLLTGFPSIDQVIGGLPMQHMSVMAGMTSGFKTAALVELMRRVALRFESKEEKQAVVIFSAEMSEEKLAHRLASNLSGVPQRDLRPIKKGFVPKHGQFERYEDALAKISGLEIFVNDEPSPSFETMYAQCLAVQASMPISFIGFDYLEKMYATGDSEELRVSRIAQDLSRLAKAIGPPVVTLSQYSRKAEVNKGTQPLNSWLRYSGKIEQEAATIIHWYYPKYFVDRGVQTTLVELYDSLTPNKIYAVCGKNRDGVLKNLPLTVVPETGRFIDPMDARYEEHPGSIGDNITNGYPSEEAPF